MAVRQILIYPDKFLRNKTHEIRDPHLDQVRETFLPLLEDMEDTLEECDRSGLALAANQVGINARMIVTNQYLTMKAGMECGTPGKPGYQPHDPVVMAIPPYIINPKIVKRSPEQDWLDEGCLSFPNFGMKVKRHRWVKVEYGTWLKINGKWDYQVIVETYHKLWAQMFQHEIDHLDGKLFVDALPQSKRLEIVKLIQRRK
jgi:peptide deformylase